MTVVYTAGVWDLLHDGHLNLLESSAALGDRLVVGVVSDVGAEAYKRRPVQSEDTRLRIIRALRCVDRAFIQPTTDPSPALRILRPDILTHGDDWPQLREGHETLAELGVRWVTLPYTPGVSTSALIEAMA